MNLPPINEEPAFDDTDASTLQPWINWARNTLSTYRGECQRLRLDNEKAREDTTKLEEAVRGLELCIKRRKGVEVLEIGHQVRISPVNVQAVVESATIDRGGVWYDVEWWSTEYKLQRARVHSSLINDEAPMPRFSAEHKVNPRHQRQVELE